jgi:SM-20-related protein
MGTQFATQSSPAPTCPHLVFREVFGAAVVAGLLDHVGAREADFQPSIVRYRNSQKIHRDGVVRSSLSLKDFGAFKAPLESYVRAIASEALTRFNLVEPAVEPKAVDIAAYRDGSHFGTHIDTNEHLTQVRVLSCVYYFSLLPRRFSGGELRLYGLPTLSTAGAPAFVDVVPETDTMVVFPSWMRHEVRPVSVPSGAWLDSRFSLNCWLHRASPAAAPTPVSP